MQFDFSNTKRMSFEPVPAGRYPLQVTKVEQKQASTGTVMLHVSFIVNDDSEYQNRKVNARMAVHPNSLWAIQGLLIALGYTEDEVKDRIDVDPADLVGLECSGELTINEYNGRKYNDAQNFNALATGEGYPEDPGLDVEQDFGMDTDNAATQYDDRWDRADEADAANFNKADIQDGEHGELTVPAHEELIAASELPIFSPSARKALDAFYEGNEALKNIYPETEIKGNGKNGVVVVADVRNWIASHE